jgi:hypothetical protein
MVINSNFNNITEKSEQLSAMMQDISEELNTHKEAIYEKSGSNEQSIVGLQEKMTNMIVEKDRLYSIIENSKSELKDQNDKLSQDFEVAVKKTEEDLKSENLKINNKISDMQNKSESALQAKSDELNELGKKYTDLHSMRNTIDTNIGEIKDARDDHQLLSNRLDGWMNIQEKKYKMTSLVTAAAILLIGVFAIFNGDDTVQTTDINAGLADIGKIDQTNELAIEDDEVVVDSGTAITDDGIEEDSIISSDEDIVTGMVGEEEVAMVDEPETTASENTARVETAFAKAEQIIEEKKSIDYIVKKDDNLWRIAKRFYKKGHFNKKIIEDNKLNSPEIKPGDVLRIYL